MEMRPYTPFLPFQPSRWTMVFPKKVGNAQIIAAIKKMTWYIFISTECRLPPSQPAVNYPQLYFEPKDGLPSTSRVPQPYLPYIPSNIAPEIAELEAQYGISAANYLTQQTYYPAVAQYGSCGTPAYSYREGMSGLGRTGHLRVRNRMTTSGLAMPPYSALSSGPLARPEHALLCEWMGDHDRRSNPSIDAVEGTETLTSRRPDASVIQNPGEPSGVIPAAAEDREIEAVVQNLIPDTLPNCDKMRAALWEVMKAPWKINNEVEPEPILLLQFMRKNGQVWQCLLYNDGRPCVECSAKKRIQALEHMRLHIDLKPFACTGEPW